MKKCVWIGMMLCMIMNVMAEDLKPIQLKEPDLKRGENVMLALKKRKSTREFSDKKLSVRDLSDLLWAANGINRPEENMRTAPSALNKQDIDVYVCLPEGCYFYNFKKHLLEPICKGDFRQEVRGSIPAANLILVSQTDEKWSGLNAGVVSQNISLFCAGVGLATVPCGSMDREKLTSALKLKGSQTLQMNHPVGYFKEVKK